MSSRILPVVILLASASGALACDACQRTPKAAATAATAARPTGGQLAVEVTEKGFEPAIIQAKKGEPLTLVVTRKTDRTCATEIVMKDYGIDTKLPLGQPVTVRFTPDKAGDVKYTCAMGMIGGVLRVE